MKGARKDPWTEEEDLEVMRNDITTREIAILLDRDEAAIQSRRSQLRAKARRGALRRVCKGCGEAEVPHRNALCAGCKADRKRSKARRDGLRAYYAGKVASDIRVDDYGFAYKASTCLICGGVAISRGVKARKFCSRACSRGGVVNARPR